MARMHHMAHETEPKLDEKLGLDKFEGHLEGWWPTATGGCLRVSGPMSTVAA